MEKAPQNSRRKFLKNASVGGLGMGLLLSNSAYGANLGIKSHHNSDSDKDETPSKIMITDLKCAIIGGSPIVRIVTNTGISGYGQAETAKNYLKPYVLFYKDYLIGMDPTNVERVMLKIRRLGGFKPWGAAVSAIEMALWDVAGKIAGVPVYKLLGGKIRDHVRVYGRSKNGKEGFTIIKIGTAFHSKMPSDMPDFFYGDTKLGESPAKSSAPPSNSPIIKSKAAPHPNRGPLTEKGFKALINQVEKWKIEMGDEIGLALDCGPGFMLSDAIRLAKAMEQFNLMWIEDLLTGDYYPYVMADLYKELSSSTSTPIHTGEQIYLRQNFRELIETNAVDVIGPDPADIGGISELKWVAEYADLHGIQMAPHGIGDGLFGLAAHVQAGAAMPENYIAFEFPNVYQHWPWWAEIVEGLPDPLVNNGLIEVWDKPGMGINFIVKEAQKHLNEEDKNFFD